MTWPGCDVAPLGRQCVGFRADGGGVPPVSVRIAPLALLFFILLLRKKGVLFSFSVKKEKRRVNCCSFEKDTSCCCFVELLDQCSAFLIFQEVQVDANFPTRTIWTIGEIITAVRIIREIRIHMHEKNPTDWNHLNFLGSIYGSMKETPTM